MDIRLLDAQTLEVAGSRYRCAIGKNGLIDAQNKCEGDGHTPRGIYPLRACYYRPDKWPAPPQTGLPLVEIRPDMGWCDDPAHPRYNQLVRVPPPLLTSTHKWSEERTDIPSPVHGGGLGRGRYTSRNRKTQKNAKELRYNQTDVEKKLWSKLRAKRLDGHRFRRQYPVGHYIVDFACIERQLIVELDGGQHAEQIAYDQGREGFLHDVGFRVLRFWNNEVLENMEGVLESIMTALQAPLPSSPRKRGEGLAKMGFSYENLWRTEDDCYDIVIPLGYNDDPIMAGRGSAIFLHIARPDYSGTEGCVAVSREDMPALLKQLCMGDTITIVSAA